MQEDMDPFECHNEFTILLSQNLSSARVVKEIIAFAYSQLSNSEVIYQVLMDSIRQAPVMKRLTLFYLIDALYKYAPEQIYGKQILRNLKEIVDLTVDYQGKAKIKNQEKSGGLLNVQGVRKVLGLWLGKGLIEKHIFDKMDKYLSAMQDFDRSSGTSLTKEAIWRRMEDDRDRVFFFLCKQKRAREDSWTRTAPYSKTSPDPEFTAAWAKCKSLSDHDFEVFKKIAAKADIN